MSDDGRHGLTVIAFIGSVFSPYYAFARRRGPALAENHVAMNVALYGAAGKRWAMTERGSSALNRGDTHLEIGPSSMSWDGNALRIDIEEMTVPIPRRLKGTIRVHPSGLVAEPMAISASGAHRWHPIAPLSRVELEFAEPGLSWSGRGYFDSNWGSEPLEAGFTRWDWSRSTSPGKTIVFYDSDTSTGAHNLSLSIAADGTVTPIEAPPAQRLPSTLWQIERKTRADSNAKARVLETLEDTPFYARSHVATVLDGDEMSLMHESLDLRRFRQPIVQLMLPFRMPRRAR